MESISLLLVRQDGMQYLTNIFRDINPRKSENVTEPETDPPLPAEISAPTDGPAFPDGFIWANQSQEEKFPRKITSPGRARDMLRLSRIDVALAASGMDCIAARSRTSTSQAANPTKESSKRRPVSSLGCDLRKVAPTANHRKIIESNQETVKYTTSSLKLEVSSLNEVHEAAQLPFSVVTTAQVKGWRRVLVCQTTRDHPPPAKLGIEGHSSPSEGEPAARNAFLATKYWKRSSKAAEKLRSNIMRDKFELQSALAMSSLNVGRQRRSQQERVGSIGSTLGEELPNAPLRPRVVEKAPPLPNHFSDRCFFYDQARARVKQALDSTAGRRFSSLDSRNTSPCLLLSTPSD